ncbi:MAG: sigma-54 dependent transcriptional regulator [Planctomycetota bacterium]|nr:sigma-54 dependent transcriptional regulator [Planctomycetota bacterium]
MNQQVKNSPRVLLAEDDAALGPVMLAVLEDGGMTVDFAKDGAMALELYEAALEAGNPPDLVISDINMPKIDGLTLISRLKDHDKELPVIFVTAYSSVDSAIEALRKGAYDYLTKPFRNDRLLQVARNAYKQRNLEQENQVLKKTIQRTLGVKNIVSRSPSMDRVFRVIEKAAPSSASILIRGETGTGKELVARALHHASERSQHPFVSINCGALPEGLLESELFGHEKGAFSGAVKNSTGLFRAADKGTLFLDELGEMPASLQVKLLRVLESREVRPIGSTKPIPIDVRVLGATHKDLLEEIEEGRFREDLYYRLAVIEVEVPPLRKRPDDLILLAKHFLKELNEMNGREGCTLSQEMTDLLTSYDWPGNVRELRNAMEHAATLGEQELKVEDLPPRIRKGAKMKNTLNPQADSHIGSFIPLSELEKTHVLALLNFFAGDRRRTAEVLGIDLSTLYRKIKRWEKDE